MPNDDEGAVLGAPAMANVTFSWVGVATRTFFFFTILVEYVLTVSKVTDLMSKPAWLPGRLWPCRPEKLASPVGAGTTSAVEAACAFGASRARAASGAAMSRRMGTPTTGPGRGDDRCYR